MTEDVSVGVQEVMVSRYRGCGAFVSNLGVDSGVSENNHMPKLYLFFTGRFKDVPLVKHVC